MTSQEKNLIFTVSIGEVVKAWRTLHRLTLAELAQRCDSTITKGYLSQLENSRIEQPNDEHMLSIAKALDIPVEYLVIRRLPTEQDTQEKRTNSVQSVPHSSEQSSATLAEAEGFTFGSPIVAPRREEPSEEEELLQILTELDELRNRVKKLLARKKKRKQP